MHQYPICYGFLSNLFSILKPLESTYGGEDFFPFINLFDNFRVAGFGGVILVSDGVYKELVVPLKHIKYINFRKREERRWEREIWNLEMAHECT